MDREKQRVMEMLEQGRITPDEAARLLDCLESSAERESVRVQEDAQRMRGKKLRVDVNGYMEKDKKINVNVSVPLVLARYADNILSNCVPKDVRGELKDKGIDLTALNIGAIVDMFETLQEDIVNVDLDQDGSVMKVRVYVD